MEPDRRPPLLFCPSAEPAVVFLLGLLWDDLPERFAFEEFEVSQGSKVPDASGMWLDNGTWRKATFEFKLCGCDILKEARRLRVDWLICWENDGGEAVKQHAAHVLELRKVWSALPQERRHRLIGAVRTQPKLPEQVDYRPMLAHLAPRERDLVERLCESWPGFVDPEVQRPNGEIKLKRCRNTTVLRICPKARQPHVIIVTGQRCASLSESRLLRTLPGATPTSRMGPSEGVSVPLTTLSWELLFEEVLIPVWGDEVRSCSS